MRLSASPFTPLNTLAHFGSPQKSSTNPLNSKSNKLAADTTHFSGRNALHVAAEADNADEIQELVDNGTTTAELNEIDENNHGRSPLHLAVIANAASAVKALIRLGGGALNPETLDRHWMRPADYINENTDPQIKRSFEKLGYRNQA